MNRPVPGQVLARASIILLAVLLGAAPARAQAVVGRVVDADGGAGVSGAFVVLVDSAGHRRAAVLTDGAGRFVLTAPGVGRYRMRAERIGMTTQVLGPWMLGAGERRSVAITLAADAVPLAAIEVAAKRRCELRPEAGAATARIWEDVRKALRVSAWARSAGKFRFTLRRHERMLELPSRTVRWDSVQEMSGAGSRPYVSLPAAQLARDGYVRGEPDGGFTYWAPDDEVLASDEFLDTHCLQLRPPRAGRPGMLAIDFRRAERGDVADIEGTAWLDAHTDELRSIDFRYVGLPFDVAEAGGSVEYRRLPSGSWIVERFRLAFPVMREVRSAPMSIGRLTYSGGDHMEAYGLRETSGEVVDMRAAGSGRSLLHEGAGHAGIVVGQVFDSLHARPLTGARVYLSGTVYAATADSAGRFRIAGVPPGRYAIAFDHPVMDSVPVRPLPVTTTVAAGETAEVALAVPATATLAKRACASAHASPDAVVLFGAVRPAGDGVVVRATWQNFARAGQTLQVGEEGRDVPIDAGGRYLVCGAPAERPVTLRAVREMATGETLRGPTSRVTAERGALRRVDLEGPRR